MAVLDTERNRFACGGTTVVELDGEIDLATADQVYARLAGAAADGCVIADLSAVEFIDASGVNALIAALHTATKARHHLVLASPPRQLSRILDVLSLRCLLTTHADVAAAHAAHECAAARSR
ncbi:STAS domain-containing protein [Nocardiopsis sp. EMB25]|uniref:STAS domain-containing protein n=1 Tax=Nocardiopsis TaxID=2013 RepID=UPI000348CFAD|nr:MULTISPECIES: STAS domain-containing protein [Nocardiopsis]MCY9785982.1 STAS domain-containing protein [Nocardiopsis sp. EMB25]